MLEIEKELTEKLEQMGVKIDAPDKETIVLQGVPTDQRFFNKPATNLLLKRPREGAPVLVCVDADLKYTGSDALLTTAFSSGPKQAGWRAVFAGRRTNNAQELVEDALTALGFYGEPSLPGPAAAAGTGDLLSGLATNLTEEIRSGANEITIGREEEVIEVTSCLLRWGQARMPVVLGPSGVGKTNLIKAVAAKLATCRPEAVFHLLDVGRLFCGTLFPSERDAMLASLLEEAGRTPDAVVALERVDLIAEETLHGTQLLARALDSGARLIGTSLPRTLCHPNDPLARRLDTFEMHELSEDETETALRTLGQSIAAFHGVEIDDSSIRACVLASRSLPGHLPARAIALLDAAASRSALVGSIVVGRDDLQ